MKEAIEILEDFQDRHANDWDHLFYDGFITAKTLLKSREAFNNEKKHTWQPSPDTPYKIELTKWIEGGQ